MQHQVFEGTLDEIKTVARTLKGNPKVRLIVLDNSDDHTPIKAGMFAKELEGLTEEDFKLAEWHPTEEELNL